MRTFKQYENLCSVLDALLVSQLIQEFVATVVKMFFNVTNAELSTMIKKILSYVIAVAFASMQSLNIA